MEYTVAKSPDNSWRVEAFDGDGGCHVTVFYGPNSQCRAEEYASFKNAQEDERIERIEQALMDGPQ